MKNKIKYLVRFKVRFFFPPLDDAFKMYFVSNRYKIINDISKYIIKFNIENPFQKIYSFEIIEGEL